MTRHCSIGALSQHVLPLTKETARIAITVPAPVVLQAADDKALVALHRVQRNFLIHTTPATNGWSG